MWRIQDPYEQKILPQHGELDDEELANKGKGPCILKEEVERAEKDIRKGTGNDGTSLLGRISRTRIKEADPSWVKFIKLESGQYIFLMLLL